VIESVHHVQLAAPAGSEEVLRAFYVGVLEMTEIEKPPELAKRGGAWFRAGTVELHLGVEEEFRPARKAHPGLVVTDMDAMATRLAEAGLPVRWGAEHELVGWRRIHTEDPHGNRLELLARNA